MRSANSENLILLDGAMVTGRFPQGYPAAFYLISRVHQDPAGCFEGCCVRYCRSRRPAVRYAPDEVGLDYAHTLRSVQRKLSRGAVDVR